MRGSKHMHYFKRTLLSGKRYRDILLLLFLGVSFIEVTNAQEPGFRNISVLDGLPSARVFQVKAGADGAMWFATDNGVANFDGNQFRSYGEEEGLTEPSVFALTHDNRGREWFATYSGELFYHEGDSIKPCKNNDVIQDYAKNLNIICLSVHEDTVWLSFTRESPIKVYGDGNLEVLDIKSDNRLFTLYRIEPPHSEAIYGRISGPDADSVLLVLGDAQGHFSKDRIKLDGHPNGYRLSVIRVPNGDVLAANHQALFVRKSNGMTLEKHLGVSFAMASSACDAQGRVWIGTFDDGVFVLDPQQDYAVVDHFLDGQGITSVAFDREGGVWLSSYSSGVYYSPLPDIRYFFPGGPEAGGPFIRVLSHEEQIYTATENGQIYRLEQGIGKSEDFELYAESNNQNISDIASKGEHFYYQTFSKGLIEILESGEKKLAYNRAARYVRSIGDELYSISSHSSDNGIWMNKPGKEPIKVSRDVCRASDAHVDREKNIWLACGDGIQVITTEEHREVNRELIPIGRVKDIFLKNDSFYAATSSRGLAIIDRNTRDIVFLDKENGLTSNQVHSSFVSSKGELWVSTNRGLHLLRKRDKGFERVKVYTEMDGLFAGVINGFLEFKGNIWCCGDQGIWKIPLNGQHKNEIPPNISITASELVRDRAVEPSDFQQLRYHDNSLSFRFRGIAFRNGEEIRYRYRLLGLDSNYRYTNEQQVYYTGLASGSYTFEVEAANNDGVWSDTPATMSFVIPKPFWETWWFIALIVLLVAGLVYWLATVRNRNRNERNAMKLALIESEQKALSSQINPHFLYNSLNSAQFYINSNRSQEASDHLANFSLLMRKVLKNTSTSFVTIEEELSILKLYLELEQERFDHQFEFKFDIEPGLDLGQLKIPSMVLQPHVENAIWHGLMKSNRKDGLIWVVLETNRDNLIWRIIDNGIGRQASKEEFERRKKSGHQSSGVKLTKERMELLSRKTGHDYSLKIIDLTDEEGQPVGTEVNVVIPLINAVEADQN